MPDPAPNDHKVADIGVDRQGPFKPADCKH